MRRCIADSRDDPQAQHRSAQFPDDTGEDPLWDPRGDRLYFMHEDTVTEVLVDGAGDAPQLGAPAPLFEYPDMPNAAEGLAVAADGERFVIAVTSAEAQEQARRLAIKVVTNWRREFD